jgi:hypothetical protein
VQIIKGFINKWGQPDKKISDVAVSDDRQPDAKTGKLPPVGNTIDLDTATYTNDIGVTQLSDVPAIIQERTLTSSAGVGRGAR